MKPTQEEEDDNNNLEFYPDPTKHHVVVGRPGVMVVSEAWAKERANITSSLSTCFASIKNRIVTTSKKEIDALFAKHA